MSLTPHRGCPRYGVELNHTIGMSDDGLAIAAKHLSDPIRPMNEGRATETPCSRLDAPTRDSATSAGHSAHSGAGIASTATTGRP